MKQCKPLGVFLAAVIVGAAIAHPEPGQPESTVDLSAAVDKAVRQQTAEYIAIIYGAGKEPKLEENLEAIKGLIAASLPESLRQDVASELSDEARDGTLSDGLKERIRRHILDWLLQLFPEDLRVDITTVLEEYRTTGKVIGKNEELVERIRQYVAGLNKLDARRSKRGFWSGLRAAVGGFLGKYLVSGIISLFG